MKKFLSFIIATILLTGCVSLQKREEQKELMRKAVSEALKKRQMYIDVRTMHPMRYASKTITSNYSLEVRGDTVRSYLPYIGVAHQAPMSSNPQVLNFVERILSYKESHPKANLTRIEMSLKTSEDNYEYIVVNDDLSTCIDTVNSVILSRKCAKENNLDFIAQIKNEFTLEGDI